MDEDKLRSIMSSKAVHQIRAYMATAECEIKEADLVREHPALASLINKIDQFTSSTLKYEMAKNLILEPCFANMSIADAYCENRWFREAIQQGVDRVPAEQQDQLEKDIAEFESEK